MIFLMQKETKNIWKTDATKFMAVLYLGTIMGRMELPYIISVPVEIIGLASVVIVIINYFKNKKASQSS